MAFGGDKNPVGSGVGGDYNAPLSRVAMGCDGGER